MRTLLRALLGGGLGFAVSLIVAACGGSSGLLSSEQASTINSRLDQISSAVQAGDCRSASRATVSLGDAVASLPSTVSQSLRTNLDQAVSTVGKLASQDCQSAQSNKTPTSTTITTTTTTPTTTTTTTTTPSTATSTPHSNSTPTTTTSRPPTSSSTATTPPSTGTSSRGSGGAGIGGGGNGNGNGNGNSGGASAGNGNGG